MRAEVERRDIWRQVSPGVVPQWQTDNALVHYLKATILGRLTNCVRAGAKEMQEQ
jgi:hypothetical protein